MHVLIYHNITLVAIRQPRSKLYCICVHTQYFNTPRDLATSCTIFYYCCFFVFEYQTANLQDSFNYIALLKPCVFHIYKFELV